MTQPEPPNPNALSPHGFDPSLILWRKYRRPFFLVAWVAKLGWVAMLFYYLVAIALIASCVGAIIGIPLLIGAMIVQLGFWQTGTAGTWYHLRCPVCLTENKWVFRADHTPTHLLICHKCRSKLVVREEGVKRV